MSDKIHKPQCNLKKGWPHPCECNCDSLWTIVWTTERGQFDITETVEAETREKAIAKLYRKHGDICIRSEASKQ